MRVSNKPPRYPWWQLVLLGIAGAAESLVWPLRRMWRSEQPLDRYGLCHFTSVAGDALLAISLADSVFFSLPVGQAKTRVALYLLLTMVPLALAGPLLIPLLDRAGPRRAISFAAAAGRAVAALYAAPRVGTLVLFPAALVLLVLSKVHAITKNGLTTAYAPPEEGLMRANARLGRIAVAGAIAVAPLGYVFLKVWGASGPIYLAAAAYAISAALNLRLPNPQPQRSKEPREVGPRGRIPALTGPAIGAVGMRAASGFLLFLLAISLRDAGEPVWWFGVLAASGVLRRVRRRPVRAAAPDGHARGGGGGRLRVGRRDRGVARVRGVRAPAADGLRVRRGRRIGAQPAGVPEPDAAQRPGGSAGARVRPLRGGLPAGLGRPARSSPRCCRSTSGWAS